MTRRLHIWANIGREGFEHVHMTNYICWKKKKLLMQLMMFRLGQVNVN